MKLFCALFVALFFFVSPSLAEKTDWDGMFKRAHEAASVGKHREAIELFSTILKQSFMILAPEWHAILLVNRAGSFHKLRDYPSVISDASAHIELADREGGVSVHPTAYYLRGAAQMELGEIDAAISDFDKTISIDPKYVPAYADRAVAYEQKGGEAKAIEDFKSALAIYPEFVQANFNLGVLYVRKKMFREAIKHLNSVVNLQPEFAPALAARGQARQGIGLTKAAIRDFEKACELGFTPRRGDPISIEAWKENCAK